MTLNPLWRTRLVVTAAALLAVWIGTSVAQEQLGGPSLVAGALGALILLAMQPLPPWVIVLGVALVGYVVGNRGFAQISLSTRVPLLPAEFALLVGGGTLLVQCALRRVLPMRRAILDAVIVLWMLASSLRLYGDLREYGVMALRDYAMVYYAAFFFLAQAAAETETSRRFLGNCVKWSCAALLLAYPLFVQWPDFFLGTLTFRGTPLIFFKGDLAGTFMAVGAILFFVQWEKRRSLWALAVSLALAGAVIATNNRASMLGLAVATALLAVAGRWRFAAYQAIAGVLAASAILFVAYVSDVSWEKTPVYGAYERVMSFVDPYGQRTYAAEDAFNKGDNNLFRLVWWRAVYDDTVNISPVTGLGFGYDLAARFVREYYADADEFNTRSPHNFLLTVFARTGLIGLIPVLLIAALIFWRTIVVARRNLAAGALWASSTAILASACFGVVLEGPMGAVVFWTVLGLAAGTPVYDPVDTPGIGTDESAAASLPAPAEPAEVGAST